ncbi:putative spermidine/putrescine transport system permease protein [Nocardioides terrae]|uniref:Putative spermidine/putrescine transport system permease protein n=1 Tax=Nocardioides terrae TaxID=574651 RepID=A0A1I1L2E4_9ACTN|nr:sugar ABC transporter permease [Nocardioides terrae]SFC67189.1 putative spermidine/putrescine transport system permease protein [Nocardioides terrae]
MTVGLDRAAAPRRTLRHRLADRGIDRTLWLVLPATAFVLVLFVYPFIYGLELSFQPLEGGGAFANYKEFFSDPYLRDTIWKTMRLALPAAVFNVAASVPVAYAMRGRVRGKRTITTLLVIPITLGTVLTAQGLIMYAGPRGWLNRTLTGLHLIDQPVVLVHNYTGVFLSLVITGFPFAFLLTLSYLSGIDPALEKAAATLGAGSWQRFRKITLPLLAPGLAITFTLAFVLAFSVFPSAQMVGKPTGATRVISIAAYDAAFQKFDYSMGSTIAMIMAVIMLIVIALVMVWRATLYRGATGGKG